MTLYLFIYLKSRPKDAVLVLSRAIEILNSDLIYAKNHRASSNSNIVANNSPSSSSTQSPSTSPPNNTIPAVSAAEFEQLKKMKGNCHRRLG